VETIIHLKGRHVREQDQRPETINDLPERVITQEMARIRLSQETAYNQFLVAIDNLIHVLRHSYGDEALKVNFEDSHCTIERTLDSGEQAKLLAEAQEKWDSEHERRDQAAARDSLKVGDHVVTTLGELGGVGQWKGTCYREVGDGTCSLTHWHFGRCILVRDGKVAAMRSGPRQ
jgi:hypothetical protein